MTKATLHLDSNLYKAAKIKAAHTDQSISEVVNEALSLALKEDLIDVEAVEKRRKEPKRSFESVLKNLKSESG